ncbi:hypothetical protein ACEPAG_9674 [Sanghuangporus baumii]
MKDKTQQEKEKLNIEESREKRLERIKAKRRDRGGIFQPREDNPLLDILMSRDVSGRSPTKPKSQSRHPPSGLKARGTTSKAKKSSTSQGIVKRESVTSKASSAVAAKRRRKSKAPPSIQEDSDDEITLKGKMKFLGIPRNSSKLSENSKGTSPGKYDIPRAIILIHLTYVSAPSSKRPRQAEDNEDTDSADLPSPPKRLRKSGVSKNPTSTSASKMSESSRKPPSNSKARSKAKGKASSIITDDAENEEMPRKTILSPIEKKRGKPKKIIPSTSKEHVPDTDEVRSASASKPKRPPKAEKAKSSTKPVEATLSTHTKKTLVTTSSEEALAVALNTGFDRARGKRKKKVDPVPEPESKDETHYRTKVTKPRLDTVFEEDEEGEPLDDEGDDAKAVFPGQNSSHMSSTPMPNMAKVSGKRKGKLKADEDTVALQTLPETVDVVPNKTKTKGKTGTRTKPTSSEATEQKQSPIARRKPKSSSASTKRTSKPTSKSKSTRQSKPKTKHPSLAMQKSRFANLPMTQLGSPLKAADNEDDEIDFLS